MLDQLINLLQFAKQELTEFGSIEAVEEIETQLKTIKEDLPAYRTATEIGLAMIEEATFNGFNLTEGEIEHQLGTIWVGNCAISIIESESD